ncbi:MAG: DUF2809 domain-containing protein [Nitrospira sp.]|nr:DUF2809 domain-containing protein [Nitrospira sp.]
MIRLVAADALRHPTIRLLTILAVFTPLGLATKLYEGPGAGWTHAYAGALCYEFFWVFLLKLLFPHASILSLATGVFLATSWLEFLQLNHHPWLEWVRSFFLGEVLIGNSFDPWDFLYYGIGSAGAVLLYHALIAPSHTP